MSFHRRTKVVPTFNMSSMTDIIFLLLIFFMITSTMVAPNALNVNLPQSRKQSSVKAAASVVIDEHQQIYASADGKDPRPVTLQQLPQVLANARKQDGELYVTLYADETVPYRNIVEVLNVANDHHFKMVLATRAPEE